MKPFEDLIAEAETRTFEGWDFDYLKGRLVEEPPPWDYRGIVSKLLPLADSLVDLGTGGGELLSPFHPLPRRTSATEGYPPNVPRAKRRLQPLGVEVIMTFCDDNTTSPQRGALPFKDGSMDLVIDRHESFIPAEVSRVLKPSGHFITEQVGGVNYPELNATLSADASTTWAGWGLDEALRQVHDAGLVVTDSQQVRLEARFYDIGAIVYYLRAVPWQVPKFSVNRYYDRLRELDRIIRRDGELRVTFSQFLVHAIKLHT